MLRYKLMILAVVLGSSIQAQVDESQLGGWYMFFWKTEIAKKQKLGLQGDVQLRNWGVASDLEQLLLRGGLTYKPTDKVLLTFGYGNITSGVPGESGETTSESRIYQEALISQKLSKWLRLNHRFRYEQRWVEGQDTRTRYRYALFATVPITNKVMNPGGLYIALYNELFINGQREIGDGRSVELFDRNRFYTALGYVVSPSIKVQLGHMIQTTDNWSKNQLQFSAHTSF